MEVPGSPPAREATPVDDVERVHAETREQWRGWLAEHAAERRAVWLVSWRKHTGRPAVSYEDAVSEALAYGWVDSRGGKVDDDRTMLYFARRKRGSGWARPNKRRVEELERSGLMTEAGRRVVAAAKADGSWTLLDAVEDLVVPDDLAAAFATVTGSRDNWEAFPRSVRRGILEWIVQAKRPPTRAKRVRETAELAGRGERANQWRSRGGRPGG
jgi:uncharacterized protein YdeI (YjbR/CyaY-like superfamily)